MTGPDAAARQRAHAAVARDPLEMLTRIGRSWGWFAFFGAVSVVVGIIALVWPGQTLVVLAVVFGIQLIVSGVFRLIGALVLDDASGGARVLMAILGLLGLLVGLYALRHAVITLIALALVLGIYWIIDGVTELFAAIAHPGLPGRGWTAAAGVLGIIAGIIVLAWPGISLLALAIVLGIWLIIFGIGQLMTAFVIRRIGHEAARIDAATRTA